MSKRKNPAAVALGRKGGEAYRNNSTKEERIASARHALAVRYGKAPKRWYGLMLFPADYVWHGADHAAKVLDELEANLTVIFSSTNRAKVVKRAQEEDVRDRLWDIIELPWDPRYFKARCHVKENIERKVKGLRVVLDSKGGPV